MYATAVCEHQGIFFFNQRNSVTGWRGYFGTSCIHSVFDADTSWFLKINSHV